MHRGVTTTTEEAVTTREGQGHVTEAIKMTGHVTAIETTGRETGHVTVAIEMTSHVTGGMTEGDIKARQRRITRRGFQTKSCHIKERNARVAPKAATVNMTTSHKK